MKKLVFMFVAAAALTIAACGKKEAVKEAAQEEAPKVEATVDSAKAAVDSAAAKVDSAAAKVDSAAAKVEEVAAEKK